MDRVCVCVRARGSETEKTIAQNGIYVCVVYTGAFVLPTIEFIRKMSF